MWWRRGVVIEGVVCLFAAVEPHPLSRSADAMGKFAFALKFTFSSSCAALVTKQSRRATSRKRAESSPSSSPWILTKPAQINVHRRAETSLPAVQTLETRKSRRERQKQPKGSDSTQSKLSTKPIFTSYPSPSISQSSLSRTLPPNLSPADFVRSSPPPPQKHSLLHKDSPLHKHSSLPPTRPSQLQEQPDDTQPVANGVDTVKPPSSLPIDLIKESPQSTLRGKPHISSPQSTNGKVYQLHYNPLLIVVSPSKTPMPSDEVLNILFSKLLVISFIVFTSTHCHFV